MLYSKLLLVALVSTLKVHYIASIKCYTCESVSSNDECRTIRSCIGNSVCMNLVRLENGLARITKRCQQKMTCAAASRENHKQCQPAAIGLLNKGSLSNFNLPPSLCRSCCDSDLCNNRLYLQEDSTIPRPKIRTPPKWRPLQPAIRDVAVFLLGPDAALITFTDIKGHPASFFNVQVLPRRSSRIAPVFVRNNTIQGINFDHNLPNGTIAFLARGLSAGNKYSISVTAKHQQSVFSKKIFHSFYTRPRPPSSLKLKSIDTSIISVSVGLARPGNGDRVHTYELSYRRFDDPVSSEVRLPSYNRPGIRIIPELTPATKYVISAWTSVAYGGKTRATSTRVNVTVTTAVPGIAEVMVSELHATSISWTFVVPAYVTAKSQERFIVTLRDDTNGRVIVDTTLDRSARSYTAEGLTPKTTYTLSLKASTEGKDSITAYSEPTTTLVRCYSCYEARSRDECDQWVECSPEASGCLNEIRKHGVTNTLEYHPEMYRARMLCKQPNACNNNEKQNATEQCNPDRDRNVDPPDVCRCCCEGDLCNGPGSVCGHVLGWLDPFRSPELVTLTVPVYCPEQEALANGYVACSHGLEIGSTCSYSCAEGYYLAGLPDSLCQEGGRWSTELPQCLELRSCDPIDGEGMILNCSKRFEGGSSCTLRCVEGYMNTGVSRIKCSRSGKWNEPVPACLQIDDCLPNPCMNGAHCHDLINDFECECVPGWLGRFCDEEVFCEVLEAPENGLIQCTDNNRFESRCRYACAEGYEQHGAQYTRCMADGYWSSYEPTRCVIKNCPVPTLRLVNGGEANCTGYQIGDHCDFSCPPGLAVAGGPDRITCQRDQTWTDKVPCCDLPCPPHALVDLLILLDSSSSVGRRNWRILIDFTLALLDSFVIGPEDMRVGVARYNRRFDRRSEILVGDYENVDDLRRKLRRIPYNGGGTLTGKALWHLHNNSILAPGNRPDVPDVIVVITDGMATDDVEGPSQALKDKGVKVYVVGVVNKYNRMSMSQLQQISSGPDYLKIIDEGYQQLARDLTDRLTRDVCWLPCNVKYEQRELINRQRMLQAQQEDANFWAALDRRGGSQPETQTPVPTRGSTASSGGSAQHGANLDESDSSPLRKIGG